MRAFIALISGTIFGLGLTIASMTNPAKVIGFLNIFGAWDPSLAFVMLGAILVSAPVIYIQKNKLKPLFADSFSLPALKEIDKNLVVGSLLFGVGWGLIGLCPGPAVASLVLLNSSSIIFIISMLFAFTLVQPFKK
jgi:uncharacterized membrane protein YedE/YeeE